MEKIWTVDKLLKNIDYKNKYFRVLPELTTTIFSIVANAVRKDQDENTATLFCGGIKEISQLLNKIDVDFIGISQKYYEIMFKADKYSASSDGNGKVKAMRHYNDAAILARQLVKSKELPSWISNQMLSKALSCKAMTYFYKEEYGEARSSFQAAKKLQQDTENNGSLIENSFNDKLAEIVIYQMPNFAAYSNSIEDVDGLGEYIETDVDPLLKNSYSSMIKGSYDHSPSCTEGLLDFILKRISEGEIIYRQTGFEDAESVAISINRNSLLTNAATYYSNKGYCYLLIGDGAKKENYLRSAAKHLSQSLIVSCNAKYSGPTLKCSNTHLNNYLNSGEIDYELQRKLARNVGYLIYTYTLLSDQKKLNATFNIKAKLIQKESQKSKELQFARISLKTSQDNLDKIKKTSINIEP